MCVPAVGATVVEAVKAKVVYEWSNPEETDITYLLYSPEDGYIKMENNVYTFDAEDYSKNPDFTCAKTSVPMKKCYLTGSTATYYNVQKDYCFLVEHFKNRYVSVRAKPCSYRPPTGAPSPPTTAELVTSEQSTVGGDGSTAISTSAGREASTALLETGALIAANPFLIGGSTAFAVTVAGAVAVALYICHLRKAAEKKEAQPMLKNRGLVKDVNVEMQKLVGENDRNAQREFANCKLLV
eukprot:GHVT01028071.1.p1 GENE.GHVT01028071.1~~GHVT01028071.1.p1  ORF type:complete len:240 (-),score=24.61 GHVT01028071.1:888-1607(-)